MKSKTVYLTIEEKRELALKGLRVPVCVGNSYQKKSFIAKLRGTIFDGSLKNKGIGL